MIVDNIKGIYLTDFLWSNRTQRRGYRLYLRYDLLDSDSCTVEFLDAEYDVPLDQIPKKLIPAYKQLFNCIHGTLTNLVLDNERGAFLFDRPKRKRNGLLSKSTKAIEWATIEIDRIEFNRYGGQLSLSPYYKRLDKNGKVLNVRNGLMLIMIDEDAEQLMLDRRQVIGADTEVLQRIHHVLTELYELASQIALDWEFADV